MSEKEWLDNFRHELKIVMDEYGYSQRDLAEATGLSEATISNYINGRQIPKASAIVNIVLALDCDFETLLYFGEKIKFEVRR